MKTIFNLLAAMMLSIFACAQSTQQIVSTNTQMTTEQEFSKKYNMNFEEFSTKINGYDVLGTPFLYHTWHNGQVSTPDGREFTGYKLKYNIFKQTVSFFTGTDSLEINEEIKKFALLIPSGDTVIRSVFINANEYKKEKNIFYYELLLDHDKGQLLKTNTKKITELSNSNLPAYNGKKVFNLEMSYYYFDKKANKISKIKATGSNLIEILGITPGQANTLQPANYNFQKEDDLVNFMLHYFLLIK